MYNKIIDILDIGSRKVSLNFVFWAGVCVVWTVLLLAVVRGIYYRNYRLGYVFSKLIKIFSFLYFVFAYFAVSTKFVLNVSNFIIYMGFPVFVLVISYILYCIFFGEAHCKYNAVKTHNATGNNDTISDRDAAKWVQKEVKKMEKREKRQKEEEQEEIEEEQEQRQKKQKQKQKEEEESFNFDDEPEEKPKENKKTKKVTETKNEETETEEVAFDFGDEEDEEAAFAPTTTPTAATKEQNKNEAEDEAPMFIVSKVMDDEIEKPITPISMARNDDDRIANISRLGEQIERKRQANIEITDGKKENRFTFESETKTTRTDDKPKVVARQITETVSSRPLDTTPKTGFTARKIVETKTSERTYTGSGISASSQRTYTGTTSGSGLSSTSQRTYGTTGTTSGSGLSSTSQRTYGTTGTTGLGVSASRTTATTTSATGIPKRSASDILAALENLKNSMNKKP
jgi:hypothetical protein